MESLANAGERMRIAGCHCQSERTTHRRRRCQPRKRTKTTYPESRLDEPLTPGSIEGSGFGNPMGCSQARSTRLELPATLLLHLLHLDFTNSRSNRLKDAFTDFEVGRLTVLDLVRLKSDVISLIVLRERIDH